MSLFSMLYIRNAIWHCVEGELQSLQANGMDQRYISTRVHVGGSTSSCLSGDVHFDVSNSQQLVQTAKSEKDI